MPYASKAQQGYMHAAAARGDVPKKVVREFDKATTAKEYAHLPEHAEERDARGGFAGRLAQRYFGGGRAGLHHMGSEHDERDGSYANRDDHAVCQHFAHGGMESEHSRACYDHPEHPMYGGGFPEDDSREDVDEPEEDFERDEERAVGEHPRGGELRNLARGGRARFAQGGQAEEAAMHMQGDEWEDDERNRARSPLAERLSGARMAPSTLHRILRKPGSRVP